MAKKKRLTVKQLLASCKRNLDPSARLELIFQLLVDLPQSEFSDFANGLYHPDLLQKLQRAGTTVLDTQTYTDLWKAAADLDKLRLKQAKPGPRASAAGRAFYFFVWNLFRNGYSEGKIHILAKRQFPKKSISLAYVKKAIQNGRNRGIIQPRGLNLEERRGFQYFWLPSVDAMRARK
jgi:hypothetical protein